MKASLFILFLWFLNVAYPTQDSGSTEYDGEPEENVVIIDEQIIDGMKILTLVSPHGSVWVVAVPQPEELAHNFDVL